MPAIKHSDVDRMSDRAVVDYMQANTPLANAWRVYRRNSARIDCGSMGIIARRRAELKTVIDILDEFNK